MAAKIRLPMKDDVCGVFSRHTHALSSKVVLLWWLSLKPSNDGDWQADAARTAWIEVNGDQVTIRNLRNCDYRTETDYNNCWSDRTV